jgi:prephenate dehydratase
MSSISPIVDQRDQIDVDSVPLVAYQGVPGAFGEMAVHQFWRDRARPASQPTFGAALETLCRGEANYAVIPIWNSIIGEVIHSRDALAAHESSVVRVGELEVPVSLCLIARPEASMSEIRFVGSHPTALAQCTHFFAEWPAMNPCEAFNTAGAARDIACHDAIIRSSAASAIVAWYSHLSLSSPTQLAAIASERAAAYYGLTVLRRDVQDDLTNRTRFVVLRARSSSQES